ncbi:MAG: ribonuclease Y [Planctomycetes bacterium]|nr:ribonuclease Y [Planctomycetota bacterium]
MVYVSGIAAVAFAIGIGVALVYRRLLNVGRLAKARVDAEAIVAAAKREAANNTRQAEIDAKAEHIKYREKFEADTEETRKELRAEERRLTKRDDLIDKKMETIASKERAVEVAERSIAEKERALAGKDRELSESITQQKSELLKIARMSVDEARETLLLRIQQDVETDAVKLIDRIVNQAKETAEEQSREIIITAIQRYASEHTCDSTVSTVDIPSDDMKGRVIGREGRNIRAFEKATGVDVIVDDTPGVVVVSGFDPVRREVARLSLEKLIQDGRIHPARIEEVVAETDKEVTRKVAEIGKKTSVDVNIRGLHGKITQLLGRLHYRTSFGQNVLQHSIEVAYLSQMMAEDLGLDGELARRAGLLHDIGKAVDHEVEGGHPQIGADMLKRYGEKQAVINAAAGHHGEGENHDLYTAIVSAADAISASRPGARRETLERYIKRLEKLEEIATAFEGVKQAYAIQAGREIRVIVDAENVDDRLAAKAARDIAKKIEEEMTYPGEIRVTLIRETRCIEYAR